MFLKFEHNFSARERERERERERRLESALIVLTASYSALSLPFERV